MAHSKITACEKQINKQMMMGYSGVQEYQTTLGQIGRAFSHSAQQEYQMYMLMETGGGIIALVGFVLSIAGAVTGKKA